LTAGTGRLEKVAVCGLPEREQRELDAAAMFIFIGARPRTEMVAGVLELDPQGYGEGSGTVGMVHSYLETV
jgi:thioredoxin reductase (NADPH)